MKDLSSTTLIRPAPHVTFKNLGMEGILLNTQNGAYFELNETGIFLWQRLDGRSPLAHLVEALRTHFGLSAGEAQTDVRDWLTQLLDARLIEHS